MYFSSDAFEIGSSAAMESTRTYATTLVFSNA